MKRLVLAGIFGFLCIVALPQNNPTTAPLPEEENLTQQDPLVASAIDEPMAGYEITIKEDAANKLLKVTMKGPEPGIIVEVYDYRERRLLRQYALGSYTMPVSVQYIPQGIYILKVLNRENKLIQTFQLNKDIPI